MSNLKKIDRAPYWAALVGLLLYYAWHSASQKSTLESKVRNLEAEKTQLELTIRSLEAEKRQRSDRER